MKRARFAIVAAGLVAWSSVAGLASAQTLPSVELAGGVGPLTDSSASLNVTVGRPAMSGWNADVAFVRNRVVSIVAAVDGATGRDDGRTLYGDLNRWRDVSVSVGTRWTARLGEHIAPYGQVLGGFFHSTQSYRRRNGERDDSTSGANPLLQTGAGVNVMVNSRFGFRTGVDLKVVPNVEWIDPSAGVSMTRVFAGAVVALGRK